MAAAPGWVVRVRGRGRLEWRGWGRLRDISKEDSLDWCGIGEESARRLREAAEKEERRIWRVGAG